MNETLLQDPVIECCQRVFGIPYPYPWQRLIIASVLDAALPPVCIEGQDTEKVYRPEPLHKIAVLPTGAGKSLCWMLPAVLIEGITVAVFPLLSLMSDQKRRLASRNVPSVVLKGGQSHGERKQIWQKLKSGRIRIVLANPEVLQTAEVEENLGKLAPAFLAIDETHTVSQWGETFRPACAELGRLVAAWNPRAVLALTATAGPLIRSRITTLLFNGEKADEALADPDRPAIHYGVIPALSRNHTLERLVREKQRPMIVFGPTRSSVERAARLLRYRLSDEQIRFYHAGLEPEEKKQLEEWFLQSDVGILCATCAYGLGVDKPNIRTVIHLAPPASTEAYLQESGRASRDGNGAEAWLIWTAEDLTGLERDSRSPRPISSAEETAKARKAGMVRYAASTGRCRREILLEALGIEAQDCSGCDICGNEAWVKPPEEEVILRVTRWNRGRFRRGTLARVLIGRRSVEIRRKGLDLARGFGALSGWELEDAEEAIKVLIRTGKLSYGRFGPSGRLYPDRKSAQIRFPLRFSPRDQPRIFSIKGAISSLMRMLSSGRS